MNMKMSAVVITSALVGMPVQAMDILVKAAKDNPVIAAVGAVALLGGAGAAAVRVNQAQPVAVDVEQIPEPYTPRSWKQVKKLQAKKRQIATDAQRSESTIDGEIEAIEKTKSAEAKQKAEEAEKTRRARSEEAELAALDRELKDIKNSMNSLEGKRIFVAAYRRARAEAQSSSAAPAPSSALVPAIPAYSSPVAPAQTATPAPFRVPAPSGEVVAVRVDAIERTEGKREAVEQKA
ncbi:MAG: hypothetical protein ACHQVS_00895 [Candidatus Babeliales bacterium]